MSGSLRPARLIIAIAAALLVVLPVSVILAQRQSERPAQFSQRGTHGAVAAGSGYATDAGMRMYYAGGNAVVHELVHAASVLDAHVLIDGKAAHRAAKTGGECRDIETCDRADATLAAQDGGPGVGHIAPNRAHQAQPGDDYPAFTHEAPRTAATRTG